MQEQYPATRDIEAYTTGSAEAARSTVVEAVLELYNPAQLQALHRATLILQTTETEDA
jgi:hypothetical protein